MNVDGTTTVDTTALAGLMMTLGIISAIVGLIVIVAFWKIFTKAGQPGWAAIIPFYNIYVMLKIAGRPGWWLILFLIPVVNVVVSLIWAIDFAKSFGKGAGFGVVALWLFSLVGYLILAFDDSRYQGPAAATA